MDPLTFQPILKQIRWGGRRLGSVLNKPIGGATDYAESWEIADHGHDQSIVDGGPFDGWPLTRLVKERNAELFGRHTGLSQFPLLVKFLDAQDRLSLQVHPNDGQAQTFDPDENGKTEAWVIIDAKPDSVLYAGLKGSVGRQQLQQVLEEGDLDGVEACLNSFPVTAGDCVFIPAGTVHAIGEGILLAEIQQSSDLTFRMYDWERLGADGKPRTLHIPQALACTDFARGPVGPVVPRTLKDDGGDRQEELVQNDYFVVQRHESNQPFSIRRDDGVHIVLVLSGSGHLECDDKQQALPLGQTVLVPAAAPDVTVQPDGEIILLDTFLP